MKNLSSIYETFAILGLLLLIGILTYGDSHLSESRVVWKNSTPNSEQLLNRAISGHRWTSTYYA